MGSTPSDALKVASEVRVRFAPSPTGFLHIGGVRTALFNWLYARNRGGKFLLRIEDTDLERSEARFTDDILASMKWLGLTWDEEPIFQSKRLEVYRERAEHLIAQGHAYRCTCSEEDVQAMRERAMAEGKKPMYDRRCRDLKAPPAGKENAPSVVRVKIPLEGHVEFNDLIRGPIRVENTEIDDFVLIRSNGAPTYNLSVVVDDVFSRMTQIIRGDDHINNTPKQIHLYRLFNYPVPEFAHLPMILGPDKKKLSKRHGAVSANAYRAEGYLPEALLNFLARLGWSHGDQEIFRLEEMIQYFGFDSVQKSSAVFNVEKLHWTNAAHLKTAPAARIAEILSSDFSDRFTVEGRAALKEPWAHAIVALLQPKLKLLSEVADQIATLLTPGGLPMPSQELLEGLKMAKSPELRAALVPAIQDFHDALEAYGERALSSADVEGLLKGICEKRGVKLGDLTQPLRLAVTGKLSSSAGLFDLVPILPRKHVMPRLKQATLF